MTADLTSHACQEGHQQEVEVRHDARTDPMPCIGQEAVTSGAATPQEPSECTSGTLTMASLLIELDKVCLAPEQTSTSGPTAPCWSGSPTTVRARYWLSPLAELRGPSGL